MGLELEDDPELGALRAIVAALEPLDASARRRVLVWAAARYLVERDGEATEAPP